MNANAAGRNTQWGSTTDVAGSLPGKCGMRGIDFGLRGSPACLARDLMQVAEHEHGKAAVIE